MIELCGEVVNSQAKQTAPTGFYLDAKADEQSMCNKGGHDMAIGVEGVDNRSIGVEGGDEGVAGDGRDHDRAIDDEVGHIGDKWGYDRAIGDEGGYDRAIGDEGGYDRAIGDEGG